MNPFPKDGSNIIVLIWDSGELLEKRCFGILVFFCVAAFDWYLKQFHKIPGSSKRAKIWPFSAHWTDPEYPKKTSSKCNLEIANRLAYSMCSFANRPPSLFKAGLEVMVLGTWPAWLEGRCRKTNAPDDSSHLPYQCADGLGMVNHLSFLHLQLITQPRESMCCLILIADILTPEVLHRDLSQRLVVLLTRLATIFIHPSFHTRPVLLLDNVVPHPGAKWSTFSFISCVDDLALLPTQETSPKANILHI